MKDYVRLLFAACVIAYATPNSVIGDDATNPLTSSPPVAGGRVLVKDGKGADLSPAFLGLSYESGMLLPKDEHC